jgi:hypothetical protein
MFDLGGKVSGTSNSTSTQSASINYIPSSTTSPGPPLVSTWPQGAGLATLNTAYPGSVSNPVSTSILSGVTTALGTGSDTITLLLLLAVAAGIWYATGGKL